MLKGAVVGLIASAVLAAALWFARESGVRDERAAWEAKAVAQAALQATEDAKTATQAAATNSSIGSNVRDAEAQIVWRTREVVRRVHEYVSPDADALCTVGLGFMRVHDAAAQGVAPPAPAGDDDKASGIPLSGVAAVNASNLGTGWVYRERVRAWERWYCDHARDLGQSAPAELNCDAELTR